MSGLKKPTAAVLRLHDPEGYYWSSRGRFSISCDKKSVGSFTAPKHGKDEWVSINLAARSLKVAFKTIELHMVAETIYGVYVSSKETRHGPTLTLIY